MAFVAGFPARQPSGQTSIRLFISGTTSGANFNDNNNSFVFIDQSGANPYTPLPVVQPGGDLSKRGLTDPTVIPTNPAGTGENYRTYDAALPTVDAGGRGTGQLTQPSVKAYIWSESIIVRNTGGTNPMDISFNGTDIADTIPANTSVEYSGRREAGIAVRSAAGTTFEIVAW